MLAAKSVCGRRSELQLHATRRRVIADLFDDRMNDLCRVAVMTSALQEPDSTRELRGSTLDRTSP